MVKTFKKYKRMSLFALHSVGIIFLRINWKVFVPWSRWSLSSLIPPFCTSLNNQFYHHSAKIFTIWGEFFYTQDGYLLFIPDLPISIDKNVNQPSFLKLWPDQIPSLFCSSICSSLDKKVYSPFCQVLNSVTQFPRQGIFCSFSG